jgi:O-antigen ligase
MTLEIYLTILGIIAISVATVGVLGLFVVSRIFDKFRTDGLINLIFWPLVIANCVSIIFSARVYSDASYAFGDHANIMPLANWFLRATTMGLEGVAGIAILYALGKRKFPGGGAFLIIGLAAMFLAIALSWVYGVKFYYSYHTTDIFLLMLAVIVTPPIQPERVVAYFKPMLLLILYGSLILALVDPSKYIQSNYVGIIPMLHFRLHGLAVHANTLGPLALMYLLLARWVPYRQGWQILNTLTALSVLVLAQSKTTWVVALTILLVLLAAQWGRKIKQDLKSPNGGLPTIATLAVMFGLLGFVMFYAMSGDVTGLYGLFSDDKGTTTLTGRTVIWQITYDTWKQYPWFGYGPNLWNIDFRIATHFLAAGDAHNQFFQSLGEAGIVGMFALLLYLSAMLFYGIKFFEKTRGISLALVLFFLFRASSEVPIKLSLLLDNSFVMHFMTFVILLTLARSQSAGALAPSVVSSPAEEWTNKTGIARSLPT